MKPAIQLHLRLICYATLCIAHAHAQDVLLRLTPSESAPIVARIDSRAPAVTSARPVLEADKARDGWKWTEHSATLDGYIPTSSLSKNFEIALNTHVRSSPDTNASILTSVQANDRIQVTASNDQWTTVHFRKAVPVFFREQALPAYTADQVPGHVLPTHPQSTPDANHTNTQLRPVNVKWRAAPNTTHSATLTAPEPPVPQQRAKPSSLMTEASERQISELPRTPQISHNSPVRKVHGILVRALTPSGTRYPLRLQTAEGKRIAYVDISQVFINDLRPFLSHPVQIIGEVRPIAPGSQDLIIQARTLRLAE